MGWKRKSELKVVERRGVREKRGRRVGEGDRKDGPLASSFISFLHGEICVLDASISLSWWNRCAVNFKRHANLSHHNLSGHNTWCIYTGTIYCCLRGDGWRRWGRWAAAPSTANAWWCVYECFSKRLCSKACLPVCLPSRAYLCASSAAHTYLLLPTNYNIAYKSGFTVYYWYTPPKMSNILPKRLTGFQRNESTTREPGCASILTDWDRDSF